MSFLKWLFGKRAPLQAETSLPAFSAQPGPLDGQFTTLGDRQILQDAPYVLPKDTAEISRLDFQHFLLRQSFQGNYLAPIGQPRSILDVGTGTGRWCHEMAQAFPAAQVIGCDLVEQATNKQEAPPNYQFVEADVFKPLPFPGERFDFVHQRLLFLAIPAHLWANELRELVHVTRLGGWIELVESEIVVHNGGPATNRMGHWIIEVSRKRGIDASQIPNLGNYLSQAGLENISTTSVSVPIGHWGGRVGSMMAANVNAAYQAMKPLITSQLGVAPEAYEQTIELQQQEWEELHTSTIFYAVTGQRFHIKNRT